VKSPAGMGLLTGGTAPAFNGQYASLFPGAFLVAQTDLNLAFSGTLRPNAANTGTAGINLSGNFLGPRVPITVVNVDVTPVLFDIYFDGGIVPAMTNINLGIGLPTPLTGAGAGISLTRTAGTVGFEDNWRATASVLLDQSGGGWHYSQATDSLRSVVTPGLNGKPGLLFEGQQWMQSLLSLSSYPFQVCFVGRIIPTGAQTSICGGVGPPGAYQGGIITQAGTTQSLQQYNGGAALGALAPAPLVPMLVVGTYDAVGANSNLKVGSSAPVAAGGDIGGSSVTGGTPRRIGSVDATRQSNFELFLITIAPPLASLAPLIAALNSPQGYGTGAIQT